MAVVFSWSGDGLANGTLTTASAGMGDTAPTAIHATPPTIEATNLRSPRLRVLGSPATTGAGAYWHFTAQAQGGGRFYFDAPIAPPVSGQIPPILWIRRGTTDLVVLDITSTQRFNLRDGVGVLAQTTTNFWIPGQRYRIEWHIDHATNAVAVRVFDSESTTHLVQLAGLSANLGATHDRVYIGKLSSAELVSPIYFDDLMVTDTAEYPGPVATVPQYSSGMAIWDGMVERAVDAWLWDGANEHLLGMKATQVNPPDPAWHPTFGMPTWRDEFDGTTIDPSKWSVKDSSWFGHTPDRAVIREHNATIDDGGLLLRALWRDAPVGDRWHDTGYIDHRIGGGGTNSTETIYSQQYGRWEIRAKTPTGPNTLGTLAAFWLRCNNHLGEIDVMEAWGFAGNAPTTNGQFPGASTLTFHSSTTAVAVNGKPYIKTLGRVNQRISDYSSANWSYMSNNLPLHPAYDGYHTWGFEYMPGYIRADYDGQEYFYVTPSTPDPEKPERTCAWLWDPDFFGSPFHMRCNLHVGMSEQYWGVPNPDNRNVTTDPLDYRIKYIRAWRYEP